ncbi:MAG: hypothetical protein M0Z92_01060 [Actinomycetota bacterium]|nr:hypothetical protein [Actinomycetota bacterium]
MNLLAFLHVTSAAGTLPLLGIALLLGMIHGVTPDEHTWPITFSYAVGSYSTRGGMRAGLFFSLGFTIQRAVFSTLAYFALTTWMESSHVEGIVYVVVGLLMAISGFIMRTRGTTIHLMPFVDKLLPPLDARKQPPRSLAMLHGLIAGMGTGAFATILYTTISPAMPSAALAWLPGALFGTGTLVAQVLIGAAFGRAMQRRGLGDAARSFVGRTIAAITLGVGGAIFVASGMLTLVVPSLANFTVPTGIPVPNLSSINLGLLMVITTVPLVGGLSALYAMRKVRKDPGVVDQLPPVVHHHEVHAH